jgi:hypothetical protein
MGSRPPAFPEGAGARRLRTLPAGPYLHFSPSPEEPYVDILCIEACGTVQSIMDKRSRFAPFVTSLLAVCPVGTGSPRPECRQRHAALEEN